MNPVGETACFSKRGGAEGATGPGNSQAKGPQGDGSLESGGRRGRVPTDEVSRHRARPKSFRSPDRGGRERRSPCVGHATPETFLSEPPTASQAHAAARPAPGTGRAPGALRRLRDAGAVSRPASWPSTRRRAPPPACSMSRTWARCGSRPSPAARRQGAGDAGAGRHRRPAAGPAALHAASPTSRRHPRRPDGDQHAATTCCWSSTPPARTPTSRICRSTCRRAARSSRCSPRGLLALQGPQAVAGAGAAGAPGRRDEVHDRRLRRRSTARAATSRARATPAGTATRSRRPPTRPTPSPAAAGAARGQADRARRARFAAARSRALPLRPRHRHHDDADRGGPAVEHRQGAPHAGRLPRRRRHPEADRRGRAAQARRPVARGQGDRARGRGDRLAGKAVGKVTSGGFAPTLGRAVAMGYVERAHSANGTKVDLLVRGKPVPAEIVPMPFVKHAYYRG